MKGLFYLFIVSCIGSIIFLGCNLPTDSDSKSISRLTVSSQGKVTVEDLFKEIYAGRDICDPKSRAYTLHGSIGLPMSQDIAGAFQGDSLIEEVMVDFLQHEADIFSWEQFIAINWPSEYPAEPDTSGCFGDRKPSVWEGWVPSHRIYKSSNEQPDPWPFDQDHQIHGFSIFGKAHSSFDQLDNLDSLNAEDSPVIDKNRNYVLFEIFYNKAAYDYVTQAGLYNKKGQFRFTREWPLVVDGLLQVRKDSSGKKEMINFQKKHLRAYFPVGNLKDSIEADKEDPQTTNIFTTGEGAVILKTAWSVLLPEEDQSRYYTREIKNRGTTITVGLVGMHLIHKIAESTKWMWGTFEHIDNAPMMIDSVPVVEDRDYRFFDPSRKDTAEYNKPPQKKYEPDTSKRVPTQIVRLKQSLKSTEKVDEFFHQKISEIDNKSVWLNYRLVGTQWPFDPHLFKKSVDFKPYLLGNAVLETYKQEKSSCMGCHQHARFLKEDTLYTGGYNADFIFGLNLKD